MTFFGLGEQKWYDKIGDVRCHIFMFLIHFFYMFLKGHLLCVIIFSCLPAVPTKKIVNAISTSRQYDCLFGTLSLVQRSLYILPMFL